MDKNRTKLRFWGQNQYKYRTKTEYGQRKDKNMTFVGQILDKDKNWTRSGGLTLTWSTQTSYVHRPEKEWGRKSLYFADVLNE